MVVRRFTLAAVMLVCGLEAVAHANSALPALSTSIPEPSDFALFLLGVVGLVIGRRTARRRHRGDDDTNA